VNEDDDPELQRIKKNPKKGVQISMDFVMGFPQI